MKLPAATACIAAVLAGGALLMTGAAAGRAKSMSEPALDEARSLYQDGVLPDGMPLRGARAGSGAVEGRAAACANCHRRSGLGVEEGRIVIPPITGKYLFSEGSVDVAGLAHKGMESAPPRRSRYSAETLARAIREGLNPDGRALDYLMPRYALDDATIGLLIEYLGQLSSRPAPGAQGDILRFATVVTPDADPVKRDAMLAVLNHFFDNKNAFYRGADPPLQSDRRIHFRVLRRWQLDVWQLAGAPETWEEQLERRFRSEPVFAIISGAGGRTWEPVHRFCERAALPCLMPNVDLPVVSEGDFYPVYFSRGVLLEADVIGSRLKVEAGGYLRRHIVQVFRAGDIGAGAAQALASGLEAPGAQLITHELRSREPARELAAAVRDAAGAADVLILWLRPADLAALPVTGELPPNVFMSGLMGGGENAPLPRDWRGMTRMVYPFDPPSLRRIRMNYPLGWFNIQHIAVADERTETDTYIACSILAEAAGTMLDNFVPDHLIERVEVDLSHRIVNGYYARLGLAPGQRFASKGAYLVRFADPEGKRLAIEGDWIVP